MQNLLDKAEELLAKGKFLESEDLCKQALAQEPSSQALIIYAKSLRERNIFDQALALLDIALKIDTANKEILKEKALIYKIYVEMTGLKYQAKYREILEEILRFDTNDFFAINALAELEQNIFNIDKARELLEKNLFINANESSYNNYAAFMQSQGEIERAQNYYHKALEFNESSSQINLNLILNNKKLNANQEIIRLKSLLKNYTYSDYQKGQMNFAIANLYDREKKYDRAMEYYQVANHAINKTINLKKSDFIETFKKTKEVFNANWYKNNKLSQVKKQNFTPIFIVGMPRSGSTLVEQILSSHPAVTGFGEVNCLKQAFSFLFENNNYQVSGSFDEFKKLNQNDIKKIRENYFAEINQLMNNSGSEAEYVIDKMLGNFFFIPLIKAAFPEAIIIDSQRNALDSCLSCYKILFQGDINFCYDQEILANYYNEYKSLMSFYSEFSNLHNSNYEDLINNQESYSKSLVETCGLNWHDSCLKFYETKREVKTASFVQVRQPIYKSSINSWEKYKRHLKTMIKVLRNT